MRTLRAPVLAATLTLAACGGSSSPSSEAEPPPASDAAPAAAWGRVDRALAELGPEVGFLAAQLSDGSCEPLHEVEPSTVRPMASQFKLFVLGAVAVQVAAGRLSWDQALTVDDAVRSLGHTEGSGALQFAPGGTSVSVEEAASKMISISDNTAADMLIGLVGRDAVEAQAREWMADARANSPFLTTRQTFLLHYVPGLGDRYLATPEGERAAFLASAVDPLPLSDVGAGYSPDPRYIEEIEWFAAPEDVCRAFAGLQQLSEDAPSSPLPAVLSREVAGIGLDPSEWPTVWYKGGSEPGVLTLGWLARNGDGETFVVEAMVSNPDAALSPTSSTELVDVAREAFGLLG